MQVRRQRIADIDRQGKTVSTAALAAHDQLTLAPNIVVEVQALDVTERTAYGIVVDLTDAGYVVKEKDGRPNRYHIQEHLPLPDSTRRDRTIGEVLDLLADTKRRPQRVAAMGGSALRASAPQI